MQNPRVAYLSMEVGLNPSIPTYSGGLGILAGDTLKSAADKGLAVVGVTLLHNNGYFNQHIDGRGNQYESYTPFDPRKGGMEELKERVTVNVQGREVSVRAWRYDIIGRNGHIVPVYFLDTNGVKDINGVNTNRPWDEDITSKLYGGDHAYHRITQEVVLGIGGARMLQRLGYDVETYHMNEGHSAFLTLELLRQSGYNPDKVREKCVFTTHTPVPDGHDRFPYDIVRDVIRDLPNNIQEYAGNKDNMLNMTLFALNLSRFTNAVSQKHAEVTRKMFPGHEIHSITNGVHSYTWTSREMQEVYDGLVPEWRQDPSNLRKIIESHDAISQIKSAHQTSKARLLDYVRKTAGVEFDPELLTIGFARRSTEYKRPDLILRDLSELKRIGKGKIQLIFAGKAHPKDEKGRNLVYTINKRIRKLDGDIKAVFLPDYDMALGAWLTSGVGLWLNTPRRPREASGTSGMKAAHNAIPSFSILVCF